TVVANRPSAVLLKASYDPRWTATVDGVPAKLVFLAPSLVGVEVGPGRHVIEFRYVPYKHYTLLITIGAITLIGLALFPRRQALLRRLPEPIRERVPRRAGGRDSGVPDHPPA